MTVADGDVWYLQSSAASAPIDSIGRMTPSGATTDYAIGYPANRTSLTVRPQLVTGADGNVWFIGSSSGVFIGKLDISTGIVTFYSSAVSSYSAGSIGAGPDGKIYYSVKTSKSPAYSYLLALDPLTGLSTTVRSYDTYSSLGSITAGPDGRIYVADGYYKRIYAVSTTGGSNNTFSFSDNIYNVAPGPDGNVWFMKSGKIVKMTPAGVTTEYDLPTGISAGNKMVAGPDGAMWFYNAGTTSAPRIGRITTTGVVTSYPTLAVDIHYQYGGPVVGSDNNVWFNHYTPNGAQKIGKITTEPAFNDFPITSTYKKPGAMTVADDALWYLEASTAGGPIDSIGRMTPSGATTDYAIGYPANRTSITIRQQLVTGADGNIWFIGSDSGVFIGKLDVSTGAVTFYSSAVSSYSAGSIGTGPDGKIYYTAKYSGSPANSYLLSLDPTTGLSTTIRTYDTYSSLGNVAAGPDGRIYLADGYYKRIYAVSITGGSNNTFSFSDNVYYVTAGKDGNIWFMKSGKIVKMTPAGATTEYNMPTDIIASMLVAGNDGAMWFYNAGTTSAPKIGRITNDGIVSSYALPASNINYQHGGPVIGPDDAVWVNYYVPNGAHKLVRLGY